ncbi:hypothetical protein DEU56DRAFT_905662 [Suillus clintonianus]|uniref:uncharacterized protein n=1 Tax=Suillus clintonianus TaxID=1904413 RepID=UPI001B87BA7F|nr:uncharacterized protein DEU56DRAFT_905662 [Suillus clintonianus]KAG2156987.1 hypothetical protein DEU56DRAFT_905662 [Suillus clintonianus]
MSILHYKQVIFYLRPHSRDWPDYDNWDEVPPCYDPPDILPNKHKEHPTDNPFLVWLLQCQSFFDETIFLEGHVHEAQ